MTTYNSIEITHNVDDILDAFNQLLERSENLAPVMKDIEGVLADATERAFDEEATPNHDPWEDLSASTKAQRQDKGPWPVQKLHQSGRLASSIDTDSDETGAIIGSNAVYAAIHQFGADDLSVQIPEHNRRISQAFGKKLSFPVYQTVKSHSAKLNIPARPFIGLGPEDEDDILEILRAHLSGAL